MLLLFFVYRTIEAERAERMQVQSTVEVLDDLRAVGTAVLNGETGQRGYLLTLDRRYLAPYEAGRDRIAPALDRLRASIGPTDNAQQRALVDEIDALTRAKFDEMGASVSLVEQGRLLDARTQVLTDEGQETMERLRRAIQEMEAIEARVLIDASASAAEAEGMVLPMLGGLLILLLLAVVAGGRLLAYTAQAEAEAAQAAALAEARDRADLLARELNHRVKNIFAVVLAIVQMSGRGRPEAKPVVNTIAQRIHALLTAHQVTQGEAGHGVASLRTLVETTLTPYLSATQTAVIEGPDVSLPERQVTPLGLVLHELATNTVKYGAWAGQGALRVSWVAEDNQVRLTWHEDGLLNTEEPTGKGFGTLLMTSAARQIGGRIERRFSPGELTVEIDLPVA